MLKTAEKNGYKGKYKIWAIAIFLALFLKIKLAFFRLIKKAIILNTYFQIFVKTQFFFINFNISAYSIRVKIYYIKNSNLAGIINIIGCLIIYLLCKII